MLLAPLGRRGPSSLSLVACFFCFVFVVGERQGMRGVVALNPAGIFGITAPRKPAGSLGCSGSAWRDASRVSAHRSPAVFVLDDSLVV